MRHWRIALLLFLLYVMVMTPLMGRKKGYTVDATPSFQLTQSIVEEQALFPEQSVKQGYIYSVVYIPFYVIGESVAQFFPSVEDEWMTRKMMCWMNTVITGLSLAVLALILYRLKFSLVSQISVPIIYGFSTLALAYARYDYNKCLAALLILLSFWLYICAMQNKKLLLYLLCGVSAGLLITLRAEMAVVAIIIGIFVLNHSLNNKSNALNQLIAYSLPVFLGAVFFVIFNMLYWGGSVAGGYEGGFTANIFPGLTGFLFSPGKSIFLFNPILFLLPFCIYRFYVWNKHIFTLWISICVILLIIYSAWQFWWGGWGWGPRHLVPLIPLLCIPLAVLLDQGNRVERIALIILAMIGIFVQFLGTMVDFNDVIMMLYNNNVSEQELIWQPIWSQLLHHYLLLEHITISRMDYGLIYLWLQMNTGLFLSLLLIWLILISVIMAILIKEIKKADLTEEQTQ